jgi:hypothetical protein
MWHTCLLARWWARRTLGVQVVRQFARVVALQACNSDRTLLWAPTHGLAGKGANTPESQHAEANVQGKAAFSDPAALADFVNFLRHTAGELRARAVVSIIPKSKVAFPQVGAPGPRCCSCAAWVVSRNGPRLRCMESVAARMGCSARLS